MEVIFGIIVFIYAWLFRDVTFTEVISFLVIFLLTWFVVGKIIIKILEKLRRKEKITEDEKVYLIQLFGDFSKIQSNFSDSLGNKVPE